MVAESHTRGVWTYGGVYLITLIRYDMSERVLSVGRRRQKTDVMEKTDVMVKECWKERIWALMYSPSSTP
jgi:hypothetical protein